jgi:hypothetical protein
MSAWRNFAGPARTSQSTHSPPGAVPHSTQEMFESYTLVQLSKERRLNVGPPLGEPGDVCQRPRDCKGCKIADLGVCGQRR